MKTTTINDVDYNVDDILNGFKIEQPVSNNVEFCGNNGEDKAFVQFRSGVTYIYDKLDKDTIKEMDENDGSITHFIHKVLEYYQSETFRRKLITVFINE